MSAQPESPAVAVARAHVEAWSNHDFDTARSMLAPDVHVAATSTNPALPHTDLEGAYAIAERFREAVERYDWTLEDRRLAAQPVRVDVGVVCLWLGRVAERRFIARRAKSGSAMPI